ncbi:hypothetical protein C1645_828479 [Glomus cerebriforme]|uniref:Uncharacterized protein n=1 Tax=Glomus cerebriforme TaxID=658196 RepID=A0A397SVN7_9GLOM|nr:hypothetical protein C1645_828479 [Glomus cerebriforme]
MKGDERNTPRDERDEKERSLKMKEDERNALEMKGDETHKSQLNLKIMNHVIGCVRTQEAEGLPFQRFRSLGSDSTWTSKILELQTSASDSTSWTSKLKFIRVLLGGTSKEWVPRVSKISSNVK